MTYIVKYYRFDGKATVKISGETYAEDYNRVLYTDDYDYVYVTGESETEALEKAARVLRGYFENNLSQMEKTLRKAIDELKEFEVDEEVKIVNPGQQFDTHYVAFGGLMGKAFENGYRGPFVLGESVGQYSLTTTKFTVIANGRFDADGQKNIMLYMVAETHDAYEHHSARGANRSKRPLKAFVLTGKGLERWQKV